jgi:hypothetical protein
LPAGAWRYGILAGVWALLDRIWTEIHQTRVTLRTVLASLAEGASIAEILADFPTLTEADVWAVIAFAATSAQEDLPVADLPANR